MTSRPAQPPGRQAPAAPLRWRWCWGPPRRRRGRGRAAAAHRVEIRLQTTRCPDLYTVNRRNRAEAHCITMMCNAPLGSSTASWACMPELMLSVLQKRWPQVIGSRRTSDSSGSLGSACRAIILGDPRRGHTCAGGCSSQRSRCLGKGGLHYWRGGWLLGRKAHRYILRAQKVNVVVCEKGVHVASSSWGGTLRSALACLERKED